MCGEALEWLQRETVAQEQRALNITVDARYDGQNYEVGVAVEDPATASVQVFIAEFKRRHHQEYGYDIEGREVEIVNCRVQAVGNIRKIAAAYAPSDSRSGPAGSRNVYFGPGPGWQETPVYRRAQLAGGSRLQGPATVKEMSSTTIIHPGQRLSVDECGNLIITFETGPEGSRNAREAEYAAL